MVFRPMVESFGEGLGGAPAGPKAGGIWPNAPGPKGLPLADDRFVGRIIPPSGKQNRFRVAVKGPIVDRSQLRAT